MAKEYDADRDYHVELDVGNLCVSNVFLLRVSLESDPSEQMLKTVVTAGTQNLINEIFKLPSEYHEHVRVAKLPDATTLLPREKPIPKPKPLTKWQKYAKEKGIKKKKKENLVWDETAKEWKPRYGYKGITQNKKDWMVEIPENADPYADYIGKQKEGKKERVAKNEYQRLRNIAASQNLKATTLEALERADKDQLSRTLDSAKKATASHGRFVDKVRKEKAPKNSMKKRKFKPNIPSNMQDEKENNMKLLKEIANKKPKLDIEEATQIHIAKGIKRSKKRSQQSNADKPSRRKTGKNRNNYFQTKIQPSRKDKRKKGMKRLGGR